MQKLVKDVNNKTKEAPVFFITNDPERALGLENVLNNYHIVCIDHGDIVDYMEKSGVKIFCLEKKLGKKNIIFRNSNRLLNHELTQKYIKENSDGNGYLMTFKISSAFEKTAKKMGFQILNTSAELNKKYENKISQYETLSKENINFPQTLILSLGESNYEEIIKKLDKEIVVQFDRGHTGKGTIFINTEEEFKDLSSKFPNRTVRVSQKIEGQAVTINACVTRVGILVSGLSFQITGIPELVNTKGGTVGNDFDYVKSISEEQKVGISEETKKIGRAMQASGYLGLFGVDFILADGKIYVIEVNARQPASVPFFNILQSINEQIPLSLFHVASFLGLNFEVKIADYNRKVLGHISAGQVFLRNNTEDTVTIGTSMKSGIYRLQSDNTAIDWKTGISKKDVIFVDEQRDRPLIYKEEAYTLKNKSRGMLVLVQSKDKEINPGNEIARIQLLQGLVDDNGDLLDWAKDSLLAIKKHLK